MVRLALVDYLPMRYKPGKVITEKEVDRPREVSCVCSDIRTTTKEQLAPKITNSMRSVMRPVWRFSGENKILYTNTLSSTLEAALPMCKKVE